VNHFERRVVIGVWWPVRLWNWLTDGFYNALLVLAIIAAVCVGVVFFAWIFAFFMGILILLVLGWACGVPVTLTYDGGKRKEVYRWFTRIS